jgi:hypothetical protein
VKIYTEVRLNIGGIEQFMLSKKLPILLVAVFRVRRMFQYRDVEMGALSFRVLCFGCGSKTTSLATGKFYFIIQRL